MELAYSLASLALYDVIIYCDDSGSMAFEENGERIQVQQHCMSLIASCFQGTVLQVATLLAALSGSKLTLVYTGWPTAFGMRRVKLPTAMHAPLLVWTSVHSKMCTACMPSRQI